MKFRFFPVLCALFLSLLFVSCASTPHPDDAVGTEARAAVTHISMAEGMELLHENPGAALVDVRFPAEYAAGHIPGALLLSLGTITEENAAQVLPDKAQLILVYCRTGHRSRIGANSLAKLGYTAIYEIGGIRDYTGALEP